MNAAVQMTPQQQLQMANDRARAIIFGQGRESIMEIYSKSFNAVEAGAIQIPLRNTGLVTRLIVQVKAQISNQGGNTQTLQPLGAGNFFSRVEFKDFSNIRRISARGALLDLRASVARGHPFGAAYTNDTALGIASNNSKTQYAPAAISAAAAGTNNFFYQMEVPIAYNPQRGDLRGIIDAAVNQATAYLDLTVNPQMFKISTDTDAVEGLYKSSNTTKGLLDAYTITVFQIGYEQAVVPVQVGGNTVYRNALPPVDAGFAVVLEETSVTGLAANAETRIPFPNNQINTGLYSIYNNAGSLDGFGDVTRHKIQAANGNIILDANPELLALFARENLVGDMPDGGVFLDLRNKPVNVLQEGNITYNFTPASVSGATSRLMLLWESLKPIEVLGNGSGVVTGS